MTKILVIEDNDDVREEIVGILRYEGFEVRDAENGRLGLALAREWGPDLVVCDVMMPELDGYATLEAIRSDPATAAMLFLCLTARAEHNDVQKAVELGADDYLTKPFALQELVLRLRALDRRRAHNRPPVREVAGLRVDPFRREVYRDDRYVALTRKQFAVLEVLVAAEGGVVSAEGLLEQAWDENADPFTNAVRITVSQLRKRLGEPGIIATVPGVGYRIDTGLETEREGSERG